jgi:hypothetical protein
LKGNVFQLVIVNFLCEVCCGKIDLQSLPCGISQELSFADPVECPEEESSTIRRF